MGLDKNWRKERKKERKTEIYVFQRAVGPPSGCPELSVRMNIKSGNTWIEDVGLGMIRAIHGSCIKLEEKMTESRERQ